MARGLARSLETNTPTDEVLRPMQGVAAGESIL